MFFYGPIFLNTCFLGIPFNISVVSERSKNGSYRDNLKLEFERLKAISNGVGTS